MTVQEYQAQFEEILKGENNQPPYDCEEYLNYVKLNRSRIRKWAAKGQYNQELEELVKSINIPQTWILITEPWCGDAAQSQSFILKLAESNPNIALEIRNRDSEGSEIDRYLTNGAKSIPKLIARNEAGEDLFVWGPRPKEAQEMVIRHKQDKSMTSEEKQLELHHWYNKDEGKSLQKELLIILK